MSSCSHTHGIPPDGATGTIRHNGPIDADQSASKPGSPFHDTFDPSTTRLRNRGRRGGRGRLRRAGHRRLPAGSWHRPAGTATRPTTGRHGRPTREARLTQGWAAAWRATMLFTGASLIAGSTASWAVSAWPPLTATIGSLAASAASRSVSPPPWFFRQPTEGRRATVTACWRNRALTSVWCGRAPAAPPASRRSSPATGDQPTLRIQVRQEPPMASQSTSSDAASSYQGESWTLD
jgi:hypothetical protein